MVKNFDLEKKKLMHSLLSYRLIAPPQHLVVVGGSEWVNYIHCHQQVWVGSREFTALKEELHEIYPRLAKWVLHCN